MTVLVIVIGAILINYLTEIIYSKYWDKDLDAIVEFQREPVYEGDEAILTETVVNNKRLFLTVLSVGFQIHRNLIFSDGENASISDLSYKRDIFSVGGYQKITRKISFFCSRRGYYELDKIELVCRDPLLTGKYYMTLEHPDFFYVFPGMVEHNRLEIPFQKVMGSVIAKKNLYEDPFEFRGIREYQPTDPMNRINWKASARSDQWMVNLFDSTTAQEVRIILDLEEETLLKYNDIHEEAIRVAAALMEKCIVNGIPAGLMTNGRDVKTGELISMAPGTGPQQVVEMKKELSRIDLDQTAERMLPLLEQERASMEKTSCTYVVIAKNQQMSKFEKMQELAYQGAGVIWISTLYDDMEWTLPKNGIIQTMYWEVPK